MMGSLFMLFVIEMWLHSKTGGHSHGNEFGGHAPPPGIQAAPMQAMQAMQGRRSFDSQKTMLTIRDDKRGWVESQYPGNNSFEFSKDHELEPRSEMPPWFIVFYEQYVRQREEMVTMVNRAMPALPNYQQQAPAQASGLGEVSYFDEDLEAAEVDPMVLKKQSMQITMIEGGILFHSIFVGMTISITADGFVVLLIAIVFHQAFEGLGLGSRIAAVPYPSNSWKPWALVVAFGTTCPIGQAIGLATRNSYDPNSALGLILVGVCNAISSGLLIYAALVDLLAEDFLSEEASRNLTGKDKTVAFIYVLLGAGKTSSSLFLENHANSLPSWYVYCRRFCLSMLCVLSINALAIIFHTWGPLPWHVPNFITLASLACGSFLFSSIVYHYLYRSTSLVRDDACHDATNIVDQGVLVLYGSSIYNSKNGATIHSLMWSLIVVMTACNQLPITYACISRLSVVSGRKSVALVEYRVLCPGQAQRLCTGRYSNPATPKDRDHAVNRSPCLPQATQER
jgi:zinc transporter 1/2/3